MIESVIETKHWRTLGPDSGGTISGTAGSNAIVGVGTNFVADLMVNEILVVVDDLGRRAMGQISAIADATNLTLYNNLVNNITAAGFEYIQLTDLSVPFFRANNSINRSPIVQPVSFSPLGVQNSIGFESEINANEGVLLKSVYIRMPFQYTLADSFFLLNFQYLNNAGGSLGAITAIGEANGLFHIPTENVEIPVNAFIPTPRTSGSGTWQIGIDVENGLANLGSTYTVRSFNVPVASQINAPSSLEGQLLPIYVGARILHANQPLL